MRDIRCVASKKLCEAVKQPPAGPTTAIDLGGAAMVVEAMRAGPKQNKEVDKATVATKERRMPEREAPATRLGTATVLGVETGKSYQEAIGLGAGAVAGAGTKDKAHGDISTGAAGLSEVSTGTPRPHGQARARSSLRRRRAWRPICRP